jgi:hypothetical protein
MADLPTLPRLTVVCGKVNHHESRVTGYAKLIGVACGYDAGSQGQRGPDLVGQRSQLNQKFGCLSVCKPYLFNMLVPLKE